MHLKPLRECSHIELWPSHSNKEFSGKKNSHFSAPITPESPAILGPILPRALINEACANNSSELMYNVVCVKWLLLEFICFMHSLYKLSNRLVLKLNNILTRRPSLQKKVSSTFLSALHFKALSTFSSRRLWIVSSNRGTACDSISKTLWSVRGTFNKHACHSYATCCSFPKFDDTAFFGPLHCVPG